MSGVGSLPRRDQRDLDAVLAVVARDDRDEAAAHALRLCGVGRDLDANAEVLDGRLALERDEVEAALRVGREVALGILAQELAQRRDARLRRDDICT